MKNLQFYVAIIILGIIILGSIFAPYYKVYHQYIILAPMLLVEICIVEFYMVVEFQYYYH